MAPFSKKQGIAYFIRTNFEEFLKFGFSILHPNEKLDENLSTALLTDRLGGLTDDAYRCLVVNIPPRSLKTITGTILWPLFLLGNNPSLQILIIVGTQALASEVMIKIRKVINAPRFQSLHGNFSFTDHTKGLIATGSGGFIRIVTTCTPLSGHGCDYMIVDDPISPVRADSEDELSRVTSWFKSEAFTRFNNPEKKKLLVLMQQIPQFDFVWHLLENTEHQLLSLSAIAIKNEVWHLSNKKCLVRGKGEALDPKREPIEVLEKHVHEIGATNFAYQYLQGQYLGNGTAIGSGGGREKWVELAYNFRPANYGPGQPFYWGGNLAIFNLKGCILRDVFSRDPIKLRYTKEMPVSEDEFRVEAQLQQTTLLYAKSGVGGIEAMRHNMKIIENGGGCFLTYLLFSCYLTEEQAIEIYEEASGRKAHLKRNPKMNWQEPQTLFDAHPIPA